MPSASSHADPISLKGPLTLSVAFHALLFGSLAFSTFFSHRGEFWGGPGGGAMTVGLVSGAGIPLPNPATVTANRTVDETKGLYKAEPKPSEPPSAAKEIPAFTRNKPPRYFTRPSRPLEDKTPPPPNAVPYGQGGTPSLPYAQFHAGASEGGFGFSGGGGDFGGRFPWYVEAVRNRISSNWLQSTVDPSVRWAPRAVVTFQVLRDGTIINVQMERSSGNASVDLSARRAILNSNPLPRLPAEYSGSNVTVEFWFDFRR